MKRPATLSLFGVIHMDAVGKVTEELDAFVGDTDALFLEYPANPAGPRTWLQVFLRTPAFFAGALAVQLFLQGPLLALLVKDLLPAEFVATDRLAEANDLPVHHVDEHPFQQAAGAGPRWILGNWLAVAPAIVLEPLAVAVTYSVMSVAGLLPVLLRRRGHRWLGLALFGAGFVGVLALAVHGPFSLLLLLTGYLGYLVTVNLGIDHRNDVMLDRVERIADAEGYDDAVLVTGKGHLGGLAREAAARSIRVPSIHVSFWRDTGETHFDIDPTDLPEMGPENGSVRQQLRKRTAEFPGHLRRIVAAVVDGVVVFPLWFVVVLVVLFTFELVTGIPFQRVGDGVMLGMAYVVPVGYHTVLELTWGRTVGKRLVGFVVRSSDGSPVSAREALARNVLRPVDALLLYFVSGIAFTSTSRRQSLGDLLAGTVVGRPDAEHMSREPPRVRRPRVTERPGARVPLTEHDPRTRTPPRGAVAPKPTERTVDEVDRTPAAGSGASRKEVTTTVDWEF